MGYGLTSDIPEEITVRLQEIGGSQTETDVFEVPTIPGVGSNGILVGNFRFWYFVLIQTPSTNQKPLSSGFFFTHNKRAVETALPQSQSLLAV